MPGLKKAIARGYRNLAGQTPAIDHDIVMTGMSRDGDQGVVHIGLNSTERALTRYRRVLRSGTSVRFSVAGEVVALDLMVGRRVVGRILTSLANALLAQLSDCTTVEVVPFLARDPSTRDVTFDFPATQIDVPLETLYGDPEIHGYGSYVSYELNKVSGQWTFYRHPTRAHAMAALPPQQVAAPDIGAGFEEPICDENGVEAVPAPRWFDRLHGTPPAVN